MPPPGPGSVRRRWWWQTRWAWGSSGQGSSGAARQGADRGAGCATGGSFRAHARDDWTEIQGTEGALRVNHTDGLFVGRRDSWEPVLPEPSPLHDALVAEWEAFLPHARGEAPSPVSAEYGRLVVATVLAGMESSATGQVVPVT